MPELPEVNAFKTYLEGTSLHKRIVHVEVSDDKVIRNMSGMSFAKKVEGRAIIGGFRRGKYYFPKLDNEHHLLLHFGMTGDLKFYFEEEERPRHERFRLIFEEGQGILGFDCPRKFARILYLEDVEAYIKEIGLGEDALLLSEESFIKKASTTKSIIKAFLMNQKIIAGVGNLYADETLFQSKVHPESVTSAISKKKLISIYNHMQLILKKAVDDNPDYKNYPEDWFWQWREEGKLTPDGKGKVVKKTIAGRTTYFSPRWQKKYT